MTEEKSRKDVSYLPRSWGPPSNGAKAVKSASSDTGASGIEPDLRRKEPPTDSVSLDAESDLTGDQAAAGPSLLFDTATPKDPCPCGQKCSPGGSLEGSIHQLSEEFRGSPSPNPSEISDHNRDNQKPRITLMVCGVRFGYAGRIYHFEAADIELLQGDWVIVKTEKGVGLGCIAIPPYEREMDVSQFEGLRKVLRKAGKIDFNQKERCIQKEKEAHDFCLDKITELALPMKLVAVECFFDASKYVFYFTSEGRVDFRELVKELVSRFPVRIEMRQIGVRHEAKMIGGLACCGQELCCSRFLTDFRPVSVKMAKNQNLSLNPAKISGVCGRLMCCLGYEHNTYEEFKKGLPKIGRTIRTSRGEGVVLKHNPLAETVFVRLSEESIVEITRDEVVAELEVSTRAPIEIIEESEQPTEEVLDPGEPEEV